MPRIWKVVEEGEYPVVEFTERSRGVECDHCHRVVPEAYVDFVFERRDGHHDGRAGKYAYCRTVFGLAGTGLVHRSCRD